MKTIQTIFKQYSLHLDYLDLELIIAHVLKKPREFVLTHPECELTKSQLQKISRLIKRRINNEPLAYILGYKEFYGLNFVVNKHTLIPRPETELMVDLALDELGNKLHGCLVIDIGTGSGNIIVSLAQKKSESNSESEFDSDFFAIDISRKALGVAKKNAIANGVGKKIKFLHGDLLSPLLQNSKYDFNNSNLIITANLPYLSKDIYDSAADNVKKYEPKSALYSPEQGLQHYRKLLEQIKKILKINKIETVNCFLEISPEQKKLTTKLIKNIFPKAKIDFRKDLAEKWRVCKISL